jgi:hypothetical protein
MKDEQIIITCMVLIVIIGSITRFGQGELPRPRIIIAGVLATVFLLLPSSVTPKIAVALAAIALLTTVTSEGNKAFFDRLITLTGGTESRISSANIRVNPNLKQG